MKEKKLTINTQPMVPKFFNPNGTDTITKDEWLLTDRTVNDYSGMWNLNRIKRPDIHDWYFETAWSFLWRPEEISMSEDARQFRMIDTEVQEAVMNVISFLQYLDSVVPTNDISLLMAIPDYEIRRTLMVHQFVEAGIHTYSYQYILKSLFGEDNVKINEVYQRSFTYQPLADRNKVIASSFEKLINILPYRMVGVVPREHFERALLEAILQDYFIESVVFYTGFNFFHILELEYKDDKGYGLLTGTNKNILLIRRDENTHIPLFAKVINYMREMLTIPQNEIDEMIYQVAEKSANADINFYTESIGDRIKGMTSNNIVTYIKYRTDYALNMINMKPLYNETRNPFEYIEEVAFNESSEYRKAGIFETGNVDYQHSADINVDDIGNVIDDIDV